VTLTPPPWGSIRDDDLAGAWFLRKVFRRVCMAAVSTTEDAIELVRANRSIQWDVGPDSTCH